MTSRFGVPRQATPEENARYIQGICIWCPNPHSAGRPRCESCHRKYEKGFR